jgi:hypothetical protein
VPGRGRQRLDAIPANPAEPFLVEDDLAVDGIVPGGESVDEVYA